LAEVTSWLESSACGGLVPTFGGERAPQVLTANLHWSALMRLAMMSVDQRFSIWSRRTRLESGFVFVCFAWFAVTVRRELAEDFWPRIPRIAQMFLIRAHPCHPWLHSLCRGMAGVTATSSGVAGGYFAW